MNSKLQRWRFIREIYHESFLLSSDRCQPIGRRNWLHLLVVIFLLYRGRHSSPQTSIKAEAAVLSKCPEASGLQLSVIQYKTAQIYLYYFKEKIVSLVVKISSRLDKLVKSCEPLLCPGHKTGQCILFIEFKIVSLCIAMHISCGLYCFELEYGNLARSQTLTMVTLVTTMTVVPQQHQGLCIVTPSGCLKLHMYYPLLHQCM